MMVDREKRLRKYLELVGGANGLELVRERVRGGGGEMAGLESMPTRVRSETETALESMLVGNAIPESQVFALEAIVLPDLRPVYDIVDGDFSTTSFDGRATPGHGLWSKLTTDATLKKRILAAIPAIGRIEVPGSGYPYGGTGFLVGPNLLMTNRHVAAIFARGLGTRSLRFIEGRSASIDFKRDAQAGEVFDVRKIRLIHPYWDMAILEVEGVPADLRPLTLATSDARDLPDASEVAVIGYPAFDPRNPATVQDDIFRERYQVKRMQPGALHGAGETDSFGKLLSAALHDCSTLGGNSGSAIVSLATGQVVGLHFGGRYLETNYAVPTGALARDSRVVDLGVAFDVSAAGDPNDWSDWWDKADSASGDAEVAGTAALPTNSGAAATVHSPTGPVSSNVVRSRDGSVTFEVPLRITVSLGNAPLVDAAATAAESVGTAEKPAAPGNAFVPMAVADYRGRKGYQDDFLSGGTSLAGIVVPMPEAADPSLLAPLKAGGTLLHYQNFSILMHAQRRLALVTASNVTDEFKLREPESGRDYSRKGLFDEKWFVDQRMDAQYQLPDVFYSKDDGAFDKGHIVRRDDVAWGKSFELLIKGNVDSFHVTNCSPQVAGYNRSDSGQDNWGDLENHVLGEAASERLCVFAGPILSTDDQTFVGKGPGGSVLRARVPMRFWKVIVARVSDGLAAYGFVLEQDLGSVPLEFAVPDEFLPVVYPISDISAMTGVVFDKSITAADQFDSLRGTEIALRAGAKQRTRKRKQPSSRRPSGGR
jgi:endonuclease G